MDARTHPPLRGSPTLRTAEGLAWDPFVPILCFFLGLGGVSFGVGAPRPGSPPGAGALY